MIDRRLRPFLAALGVAALWVAAMGTPATAGAPETAPPETTQVVIKDFMFTPMSLTIKAGSTVTWTNKDEEPHTVVSDAGLFRSGAMDTGESFMFKFDKPGTYRFACSIHPRMVGTIVVE